MSFDLNPPPPPNPSSSSPAESQSSHVQMNPPPPAFGTPRPVDSGQSYGAAPMKPPAPLPSSAPTAQVRSHGQLQLNPPAPSSTSTSPTNLGENSRGVGAHPDAHPLHLGGGGDQVGDRWPSDSQERLLTFDEFLAIANAETQGWAWDGILPASGVVLLVGEPRVGKTVLASLLVGATSASGAVLLGRQVAPGRVLYAHLEHNHRDLAAKLQAVQRSLRLRPDIHIRTALNLDDDDQLRLLQEQADRTGATIIIIDTIRRATKTPEHVPERVAELGRRLRQLSADGRRLVLVLHHFNKAGQIRGTTDFTAMADSTVEIHRVGNGIQLRARHHDAESLELTYRAEFSKETGTLEAILVPASARADGTDAGDGGDAEEDRRLRATLTSLAAGGCNLSHLRDRARSNGAHFGNGEIRRLLERWQQQGLVDHLGRNWSITQAGRALLNQVGSSGGSSSTASPNSTVSADEET
jgi:archaellum biogenesis ATPase FlaH